MTRVCKAPKNTKCFRIWINSLTFIQFSTCSKVEMVKIILKGLVHQKMKIVINYFTLMSIQTRKTFFRTQIKICLRWPRELNVLQLQRTHANRKSTSKSRKHLYQFDSRCCKCSQHNQIKNLFAAHFFFWLCWEYLQCVSLFVWVVRICSACVVKLRKLFA